MEVIIKEIGKKYHRHMIDSWGKNWKDNLGPRIIEAEEGAFLFNVIIGQKNLPGILKDFIHQISAEINEE